MLANPAQSIPQILKSFDGHDITLEYKYDGERAQVFILASLYFSMDCIILILIGYSLA